MIKNKKKKQYSRSPQFRPIVILPYSANLGETFETDSGETSYTKHFQTCNLVLASGKDVVPVSKRRGVVDDRGAARIFLRGAGAEIMEAKAMKRKNCL